LKRTTSADKGIHFALHSKANTARQRAIRARRSDRGIVTNRQNHVVQVR